MTNNGKRVAWVTGGGSGIGESGAECLAADGWTVVVSGRRKQELDRVVAKIAAKGGKAEAMALDVSDKDDVNRAAEAILARHGRIDLRVVLLDHIGALDVSAAPARPATSVTLLTSASGEPFYIHVFPVRRRGHREPTFAVTVRSSGADIVAFRRRYRLSGREGQIMELVCRGAANRDIARTLGITVATAKKHLGRIFDKVGVDSRAQLMARLG